MVKFLCFFVQQSTESYVNRRQFVTANTGKVILVRMSSCSSNCEASWNHRDILVCVSQSLCLAWAGLTLFKNLTLIRWNKHDALTFFVVVKFGGCKVKKSPGKRYPCKEFMRLLFQHRDSLYSMWNGSERSLDCDTFPGRAPLFEPIT